MQGQAAAGKTSVGTLWQLQSRPPWQRVVYSCKHGNTTHAGIGPYTQLGLSADSTDRWQGSSSKPPKRA